MKIDFSPKAIHKLILRILYAADGRLYYHELRRAIDAVRTKGPSFSDFVKIITDKNFTKTEYSFKGPSPELDKAIDELMFIGWLKTGERLGAPYSENFVIPHKEGSGYRYEVLLPNRREYDVILTDEGKRVAKGFIEERRIIIRPRPLLRETIFIACRFGDSEIDDLFQNYLVPACNRMGYSPIRIDMSEPTQTIADGILESITNAACVIADLTHARPSVYFEVGYAHGLGVPLLLTCRKDHYLGKTDDQRVHFDLAQYKISYWSRKNNKLLSWEKGMEPSVRLPSIIPHRKDKDISED
jgi:hypothetical protein